MRFRRLTLGPALPLIVRVTCVGEGNFIAREGSDRSATRVTAMIAESLVRRP